MCADSRYNRSFFHMLQIFLLLWLCVHFVNGRFTSASELTPTEAKAIAKDAWLYAYAPLQNYKTLYNQVVNKQFPGYVGGFNRFRNYARLYTPRDNDIVCPNNDTPYSWAWLDLRVEPIVLSLPAVPEPRYYVNQWFDLFTHNFAYTGVRSTGREKGNYLFVGPGWSGSVPEGIREVFHSETWIIGTLTRTQLFDSADIPALKAVQAQYRLQTLSQFTHQPAPASAPDIVWPVWDDQKALGPDFIAYLNFLLPFMPVVDSEREMFVRFSRIGIAPGVEFDFQKLPLHIQKAIAEACRESFTELREQAHQVTNAEDYFGSREELGKDYIRKRAIGAMIGIYANTKTEAIYKAWSRTPAGQPLAGRKHWVLRFEPGCLPPVDLFWSVTLYDIPAKQLVENPLNRYSLGSNSKGLKYGSDGSLEIYVQHENPGSGKESNWLPAPAAPFVLAGRMYGPRAPLLDGSWTIPPLKEAP